MSQQLPDVQASSPEISVGLNRVGVTGVEKLVKIARADKRPIVLMAEFEVYVDLPSWRKGADMSRNMEVIDETLEAAVSEPTYRVEDVCGDAAERLLDKHEYTSNAEVRMEAEYVVRDETPASEMQTQSSTDIIAAATATDEGTHEKIGARVTGMTVCPCSQGMSASRARQTLRDLAVDDDVIDEFLAEVPQAGHSQRGHATITIESDGAPEVDLNDLIDVARDSMSARIYNLAKFVEDCVRAMAEGVVDEFPDLPADAIVTMKQSNDESIHQHNAHAERVAEFGTLHDEVTGDD